MPHFVHSLFTWFCLKQSSSKHKKIFLLPVKASMYVCINMYIYMYVSVYVSVSAYINVSMYMYVWYLDTGQWQRIWAWDRWDRWDGEKKISDQWCGSWPEENGWCLLFTNKYKRIQHHSNDIQIFRIFDIQIFDIWSSEYHHSLMMIFHIQIFRKSSVYNIMMLKMFRSRNRFQHHDVWSSPPAMDKPWFRWPS